MKPVIIGNATLYNAPHEGRTAALSPGVPLDAVVSPHEQKG